MFTNMIVSLVPFVIFVFDKNEAVGTSLDAVYCITFQVIEVSELLFITLKDMQ